MTSDLVWETRSRQQRSEAMSVVTSHLRRSRRRPSGSRSPPPQRTPSRPPSNASHADFRPSMPSPGTSSISSIATPLGASASKSSRTACPRMHPSDHRRHPRRPRARPSDSALFTSLNEEVAAETLEEVQPKLQKALIESLDSETGRRHRRGDGSWRRRRPPLRTPRSHRSEAILEEMDPEERQRGPGTSRVLRQTLPRASMTTEYIALPADLDRPDRRHSRSLRRLRGRPRRSWSTDIYLIDEGGRLCCHHPASLSSSSPTPGTNTRRLCFDGHLVTCEHRSDRPARKLPNSSTSTTSALCAVLDDQRRQTGQESIYAEQVIALLLHRQMSISPRLRST